MDGDLGGRDGGQQLSPMLGVVVLLAAALWLAHPDWLLAGLGV